MATVLDLVTRALRDIGVVAGGEVPDAVESADGLSALNGLADQWKLERLQIPNVERTVWPLTSNQGVYMLGVGAAGDRIEDGFDGTWVNGAPPAWTAVVTGDGTVTEDTSNHFAGGSSVLCDPGTGTAAIYRDFSVRSGERRLISIYGMATAVSPADSVVIVQNLDTSNYLDSAGVWQSGSIQCFETDQATWTQQSLNFTVEGSATVGDVNTNLRVMLYTQSPGADGSFDSLVMESLGVAPIIPRPVFLDHVTLIDTASDPDFERPLRLLTPDEWAAIPQKALTSTQPDSVYYNPTHPNGTLSLHPVPTSSTLKLALYIPTALGTFASLTQDVNLPPGGERMITKNLAVELCPSYNRTPSPLLLKQAAESMAAFKRVNLRPSELSFGADALIGARPHYDIRRG